MRSFNYLKKRLAKFNDQSWNRKITAIAEHIGTTGAILLVGSATSTLVAWTGGNEPDLLTKQAMFVGMGAIAGSAIVSLSVEIEIEYQDAVYDYKFERRLIERAETVLAARVSEISRREDAITPSPCHECKYFSVEDALLCAVNPAIACTTDAHDCKDFESKETY